MMSDEDLKAAGAPAAAGKPSLMSRLWNRPITRLAILSSILVAVVLVIALPAALVPKGDGSNSDGSSGSSGSNSGSGSGSGSSGSPTSTSSGSTPTKTMTPGCGTAHSVGYSDDMSNHNITSSGSNRYYTIDVPSHYNDKKSEPWPLILDFHGASRDADNQYNNSMYYADPRGDDYIVVYPEGMGGKWESAFYADKDANDLQFVTDLLEHINNDYCIDQDRIYASGKSNGGGFVDMLACSDEGDPFAAFAMAAAALYSDLSYKPKGGCSKSRAILESHGGEDKTVPYEGGDNGVGGDSPDIAEWLGWWARRDGCKKSADPSVVEHDGYNVSTYSCDGYDDIVKGIYIPDLDHCWPDATQNNSDSQRNHDVCAFDGLDFTAVVLDWFGNWTMNNVPKN